LFSCLRIQNQKFQRPRRRYILSRDLQPVCVGSFRLSFA
jgi:hypothetical protein